MEILKLSTPKNDEYFDQTDYETNLNKINSYITKHPSMVSMVAPWCPHCQQLEPILDSLENELSNDNYFDKLKMIRINDEFLNDVSTDLQPQGFPTISFYVNGQKVDDFSGNRNLPELKEYLMNHLKNMKKSSQKANKLNRNLKKTNKSNAKKNKKEKKKSKSLQTIINNTKKSLSKSIRRKKKRLSNSINKRLSKNKKKTKKTKKSIKEMIDNL